MRKSIHSPAYVMLREALKAARLSAGLNQQELAQRLDRPQSYVAKYETGDRRLDVLEFLEVCSAVSLRPNDLLATLQQELEHGSGRNSG
jgi:transcriptional regulator with XRE-family HTH domain